jgi:hypothetical protein
MKRKPINPMAQYLRDWTRKYREKERTESQISNEYLLPLKSKEERSFNTLTQDVKKRPPDAIKTDLVSDEYIQLDNFNRIRVYTTNIRYYPTKDTNPKLYIDYERYSSGNWRRTKHNLHLLLDRSDSLRVCISNKIKYFNELNQTLGIKEALPKQKACLDASEDKERECNFEEIIIYTTPHKKDLPSDFFLHMGELVFTYNKKTPLWYSTENPFQWLEYDENKRLFTMCHCSICGKAGTLENLEWDFLDNACKHCGMLGRDNSIPGGSIKAFREWEKRMGEDYLRFFYWHLYGDFPYVVECPKDFPYEKYTA